MTHAEELRALIKRNEELRAAVKAARLSLAKAFGDTEDSQPQPGAKGER